MADIEASRKSLFSLRRLNDTTVEPIDLYITSNLTFSDKQAVAVYESPANDGGHTSSLGRMTSTFTINGFLIYNQKESDELQFAFVERTGGNPYMMRLMQYRDDIVDLYQGFPVVLSSVLFFKRFTFFVNEFIININEGSGYEMPFSMQCTEYRQASVKTFNENLVNLQAKDNIIARLRELGRI